MNIRNSSGEITYSFKPCLELEELDCNCNNCGHMVRDTEKFAKSLVFHQKLQQDQFEGQKQRLIKSAETWRKRKGDLEKWDNLMTEAEKMRFQFDKSAVTINYGRCTKFEKDVSFIPNTCLIETQGCFLHRKHIKK